MPSRPTRPLHLAPLGLALAAALLAPGMLRAAGLADDLLKLVPPGAGMTLAVEDLRTHTGQILGSPLAAELIDLPAVKAWRASDRSRALRASRAEIERALNVSLTTIRDDLLGEAFVLALDVVPGDPPDRAHGLLLVRVRDRALLDRVIDRVNAVETQAGKLDAVTTRTHQKASYRVRAFKPGTKQAEFYAIVGDDTFAWSNSEAAIRDVIERKQGSAGLANDPAFRKVRAKLPPRAVASLFINPRFLERIIAAGSKPKDAFEERLTALLTRNLAAVEYAGLAVEWRDGPIVHMHEAIDPTRLDEPLRRWAAGRGGDPAPLLARMPTTALALAVGRIDFTAVFDLLMGLVPEADRDHVGNVVTLLQGLLMGKDLRGEVLPGLGPGVLAYVGSRVEMADGQVERVPLVVAIPIADRAESKGLAAALDNMLRTGLALYALDPKRREARLHVESRETRGVRLTGLAGPGPRPSFTYAVERGILVLGNSAEAVAGYCSGDGDEAGPPAGSRFDRLRAAYFPAAESFAFLDLQTLYEVADAHRDALVRRIANKDQRPEADARRDLSNALALIRLFDAAFFTSTAEPDATAVHRTLGLIGRDRGRATDH